MFESGNINLNLLLPMPQLENEQLLFTTCNSCKISVFITCPLLTLYYTRPLSLNNATPGDDSGWCHHLILQSPSCLQVGLMELYLPYNQRPIYQKGFIITSAVCSVFVIFKCRSPTVGFFPKFFVCYFFHYSTAPQNTGHHQRLYSKRFLFITTRKFIANSNL